MDVRSFFGDFLCEQLSVFLCRLESGRLVYFFFQEYVDFIVLFYVNVIYVGKFVFGKVFVNIGNDFVFVDQCFIQIFLDKVVVCKQQDVFVFYEVFQVFVFVDFLGDEVVNEYNDEVG